MTSGRKGRTEGQDERMTPVSARSCPGWLLLQLTNILPQTTSHTLPPGTQLSAPHPKHLQAPQPLRTDCVPTGTSAGWWGPPRQSLFKAFRTRISHSLWGEQLEGASVDTGEAEAWMGH